MPLRPLTSPLLCAALLALGPAARAEHDVIVHNPSGPWMYFQPAEGGFGGKSTEPLTIRAPKEPDPFSEPDRFAFQGGLNPLKPMSWIRLSQEPDPEGVFKTLEVRLAGEAQAETVLFSLTSKDGKPAVTLKGLARGHDRPPRLTFELISTDDQASHFKVIVGKAPVSVLVPEKAGCIVM